MTWLVVPILAAFCAYYYLVIRRSGLLTADSLFVYLQLLMAVGSLSLLVPERPSDELYGWILTYTLLCYMAVSGVIQLARPKEAGRPTRVTAMKPTAAVWCLIFLSVVIVALYYRAVGYSAFLRGFTNALAGGDADIASMRLNSYSGSRYLFPGYVNQFKNALLPSLSVLVIAYLIISGKRPWFVGTSLAIVSIFGLVGTGQRGAFVIFMATLAVFFYLMNERRFPKKGVAMLVVLFIPTIILTTTALGREPSYSTNPGVLETSVSALTQFQDRVFEVNQGSAVIGFRFIHGQKIENGAEWGRSLSGILPTSRGSDLANQIFAYRYGSERGTSPPSLWGSIYHNFGLSGIFIAPFVLAAFIARVTLAGTRPRRRNSMEVMGIAGVFTTIGFWVADSPAFLLNTGLFVYVWLWWWGARQSRKAAAALPSKSSFRARATGTELDAPANSALRGMNEVGGWHGAGQ